jgi:hypothetical protein
MQMLSDDLALLSPSLKLAFNLAKESFETAFRSDYLPPYYSP